MIKSRQQRRREAREIKKACAAEERMRARTKRHTLERMKSPERFEDRIRAFYGLSPVPRPRPSA